MENKNNTRAPIALFVYNRPQNTKQVVEALQKNVLAKESDLFIYSDAAKTKKQEKVVAEVRSYLRTIEGFKSVTIIEREENFYIEKNIIDGVSDLVSRFGRVIVLEDDGVTATNFLTFMNSALDFYEPYERVMHIATFTFIKLPEDFNKTFMWRYSENTGGGWGTWKSRWDKFVWFKSEPEGLLGLSEEQKNILELNGAFKCLDNLKADPIPWDICWYIAIVKNDGLAVNSPRALIKNNGFFNGTHFGILNRFLGQNPFEVELANSSEEIILDDKMFENKEAITLLERFYASIGKRKRDRILYYLIRPLVVLRLTKLLKKILR